MSSYLQLLGTDTPNSYGGCSYHGSLFSKIFDESQKGTSSLVDGHLFFNCPEGTQRFSSEANIKLTKLKGIFYTRWGKGKQRESFVEYPPRCGETTTWGCASAVMGTPGLLFTVNDAGTENLTFFGPSGGSLCNSTGVGQGVEGVPLFLAAMRQWYFTWRPMNFRLLSRVTTSEYHREKVLGDGILVGTPTVVEEVPLSVPSVAPFFSLVLPLHPNTLLLGFHCGGTASGGGPLSSESVYSYCLVHSPPPTFDTDAAVSLGVPKGPLFGKLKNFETIFVSPEDIIKGKTKKKGHKVAKGEAEDTVGAVEGFWVHPKQVIKQTTASTKLYISLVLDANSPDEMKAALDRLLGKENRGGELLQVLQNFFPHMLLVNESLDLEVKDREVVLTDVFHLQPSSYFDPFGKTPSRYDGYLRFLFPLSDSHLVNDFSSAKNFTVFGQDGKVSHVFSSNVIQGYTAFPTARTHRYHLHFIAPHLFPTFEEPAVGEYWPYSFKFPSVPLRDMNRSSSETLQKQLEAPFELYIKYPTQSSAVALLSEHFRNKIVQRRDATENHPVRLGEEEEKKGGALVFLGTGSAVPGKYRNVSGTFLELWLPSHCVSSPSVEKGLTGLEEDLSWRRWVIILDFGEGSSGQLQRLLRRHQSGEEDTTSLANFVEDIGIVFISHGHADHHLGLLVLLELRHGLKSKRRRPDTPKLLVVLPQEVYEFMDTLWFNSEPYCHWIWEEVEFDIIYRGHYSADEDLRDSIGGEVAVLPLVTRLFQGWNSEITALKERIAARSAGLKEWNFPQWGMEVFTVDHPAHAHALLLRFPDVSGDLTHWRSKVLLFSGDTRPCDALVYRCLKFTQQYEGDNIFICLHEATFGPGFEDEAVKRRHSTLPEAVDIHNRIHSSFLVLNHFSQRYPKLPSLSDDFVENSKQKELLCAQAGKRSVPEVELSPSWSPTNSKLSFSFDLMRLPFVTIASNGVYALTPQFVALLEEYASWEQGTTKRLRTV